MAFKIHKMPEDVCWIAECDEPLDVAEAIKQMFDIGLSIKDVHPFHPYKSGAGARETSEGQRFIVIGIPERLLPGFVSPSA